MVKTQKKEMSVDEKFELIKKDLQEVVGEEELFKKLKEKKEFSIYWGTAPTGKPHLGYFVPIYKIADFLEAGCEVTVLFANIHAYLDNMKTSWDLLEKRTKYYEFIIKEMLTLIGVPLTKLKFVKGTDFQLSEKYSLDVYKISALSTIRDTQKAGAEVVKQVDNPKMSGLLYPILQSLDEVYLKVDAQFGGVDQRKIFMFAREFLPKVGYEKRIHLMNPLIPGLGESGKMSSSEPNSKIDFEDTEKLIQQKINKAYCIDGVIDENGLLAILKYILFRKLNKENKKFVVNRPEKYGGKLIFSEYSEVERAFADKKLSSIDLKQAIAEEIITFLNPLREKLEKNKKLVDDAYPK
ncbi:tyrosine--tRNA ligase [Candidatus Pacearchaeota archaeon]|nr:tyrosine--tRNA ligase [Candidatus Pacearchaeota archaeon]